MISGGVWALRCTLCGEFQPLDAVVLSMDEAAGVVVIRVERDKLAPHLQTCAARQGAQDAPVLAAALPDGTSTAAERARLNAWLTRGDFVARTGANNSRACIMCGTRNDACMAGLARTSPAACCDSCGAGDTHPVPRSDLSCADWAREHGPH